MIGSSRDFEAFQREFQTYQKLFGLTGYKVLFEYMPLEDKYASLECDQVTRVAVVSLNSALPDQDKAHRTPQTSAKHEAIHLLLRKLADCARYRYTTSDAITEACEEVVIKLEGLIP